MKKKELKNLAQKIAKAELIIQSSDSTTLDRQKAEQEIMHLSSHVDKLEDMIASIKHGYMLFETNNGMEDPKNWQIQCTAEYGIEIVDGKLTANGQLGYLYKDYPFAMDFEKSPEDYAAEGGFAFPAIDNAMVKDARLYCKAFSAYSIYTKKFMGDAYGIRGGSLNFDMVLEKGEIIDPILEVIE